MSVSVLQTALENIDAAILAASVNPKPTYSIDGQTVQWGEYIKQLSASRQAVAEQLNLAYGPGEEVWEGVT